MSSTPITVGSRLFCTAGPGLLPGTLLAPGDFGKRQAERLVYTSNALESTGATIALLELAWEVVRLREFPQHPSRLACLFLWAREGQARDFHSRRPWPTSLYEVEVVAISGVLVADMDLISYFQENETMTTLMERARRYWAGRVQDDPDRTYEILLDGSVRLIRDLISG